MCLDGPLEVAHRLVTATEHVGQQRQLAPHRAVRRPGDPADHQLVAERAKRLVQDLGCGDASHRRRDLCHERRHDDPHPPATQHGQGPGRGEPFEVGPGLGLISLAHGGKGKGDPVSRGRHLRIRLYESSPLHLHFLEPALLAIRLGELGEVGHHAGVRAVGPLAHLQGLSGQPFGILEASFQQRSGPSEQRDIPLREGLPDDFGQTGVRLDLGVQPRDVPGLEQGLHPESEGQQLELPVGGLPGQPQHLRGSLQALIEMLGSGDGVAIRAERVGQRCRVGHAAGHRYRLFRQLDPAFLRPHVRKSHREPGDDPCAKRGVLRRKHRDGLLQQVDLALVEQPDLEATQTGTEPESRAGQLLRPAQPAGQVGCGHERLGRSRPLARPHGGLTEGERQCQALTIVVADV